MSSSSISSSSRDDDVKKSRKCLKKESKKLENESPEAPGGAWETSEASLGHPWGAPGGRGSRFGASRGAPGDSWGVFGSPWGTFLEQSADLWSSVLDPAHGGRFTSPLIPLPVTPSPHQSGLSQRVRTKSCCFARISVACGRRGGGVPQGLSNVCANPLA